jgi:hypothetical protein
METGSYTYSQTTHRKEARNDDITGEQRTIELARGRHQAKSKLNLMKAQEEPVLLNISNSLDRYFCI